MNNNLTTPNLHGTPRYFDKVPDQIARLFGSVPELSAGRKKTVTVSAELHLVGTRYQFDTVSDLYTYIDNCRGEIVVMAPEPQNINDPNAIAVYGTGLRGDTQRIAYISRSETDKARAIIAQGGSPYAVLRIEGIPPKGHTTLTAFPYSKKGCVVRTVKMTVGEQSAPHPSTSNVEIFAKAETSATVLELVKYAVSNCDDIHRQALSQIVFKAYADNPVRYKRAAKYILDMRKRNAYGQAAETAYSSTGDGTEVFDHETDPITRAVRMLDAYIDSHRSTMSWSLVYYYMRRHKIIDSAMTANQFGTFIESHGGPGAQKVRKSGDYQLSSGEIARRSKVIESLSAFFTED